MDVPDISRSLINKLTLPFSVEKKICKTPPVCGRVLTQSRISRSFCFLFRNFRSAKALRFIPVMSSTRRAPVCHYCVGICLSNAAMICMHSNDADAAHIGAGNLVKFILVKIILIASSAS